jgi:hypothetical protein
MTVYKLFSTYFYNEKGFFSEIMGCANLFQRFLTLAVYCVSTPSILLTRVHVTWLVHK